MLLQEFLEEKVGIPVKTRGKNIGKNWIATSCIFCSDKSTHLGFNTITGRYNCFRCGAAGSFKSFLKKLSFDYYEIKNTIEELELEEVEKEGTIPKDNSSLYNKWLKHFNPYLNDMSRSYLSNRGFDPDYLWTKYNLFSSDNIGRFKFRCIIPIKYQNRVVSFVGRDVTGLSKLRYMNCPDTDALVPRKSLVFNIDSVRDTVIITEGPFDAMRIGDGAVATLSTQFTTSQVKQIVQKKPNKVFVLFDAEKPAQKKAIDLSAYLALFIKKVEVIELDRGDPADLSDDDVRYLRKTIFR